ncbi:MAG: hypothetical protein IPJ98_02705 [Bryobacterales bacterium]|nr:hypothetical protein [Bryobacterales bacterium]
MPLVPSGYVHQTRITEGVEKASAALATDVVRIRYELGENWTGEDAVFFRVLLRNTASQRPKLREVARRVSATVLREVRPQELGLQAYFSFRSEAEQDALKEEAWA